MDSATTKLPFDAVKELCSPSDLDRLACFAVELLSGGEVEKAKILAAAARFSSTLKPDSFHRMISMTMKKIAEAQANGVPEKKMPEKSTNESREGTQSPSKSKKRKVLKEEEEGEEE